MVPVRSERVAPTWSNASMAPLPGAQGAELTDTTESRPRLPAISLFSGAGGLDLGLSRSGGGRIEFRAWVESDPDSRETLRKNYQSTSREPQIYGDIRETDPVQLLKDTGLSVEEPFLIAGGPPCQAFSTAGLRRSVHETRGQVLANYIKIVKTARPRFFVFENVRGLLSVALKHRSYRDRIEAERLRLESSDPNEQLGSVFQEAVLPRFKALGYEVVYGLLNSADYGTAQVRWRLFVMGSRDKEFGAGRFRKETGDFLTPLHLVPPSHHRFPSHAGVKPWRTLRDAISDISEPTPSPDGILTYSDVRREIWRHIPAGKNWTYVRDNPDAFPPGFLAKIMGGDHLWRWQDGLLAASFLGAPVADPSNPAAAPRHGFLPSRLRAATFNPRVCANPGLP